MSSCGTKPITGLYFSRESLRPLTSTTPDRIPYGTLPAEEPLITQLRNVDAQRKQAIQTRNKHWHHESIFSAHYYTEKQKSTRTGAVPASAPMRVVLPAACRRVGQTLAHDALKRRAEGGFHARQTELERVAAAWSRLGWPQAEVQGLPAPDGPIIAVNLAARSFPLAPSSSLIVLLRFSVRPNRQNSSSRGTCAAPGVIKAVGAAHTAAHACAHACMDNVTHAVAHVSALAGRD